MKHQSRLSMSSMSPHRSHPMADSTRIDGTPVSPRNSVANLMHRTLSLERSQSTTNGSLGIRNASSPSTISRQKLNLSQLDPKTFVDVHSSGLASRIVAYHHDSTVGARRGLQRSMSVSNLYNPLKQPRRTPSSPLPYRPSPPTLSMTQIAPPERSFYCGNTLPGLLLSNSVVGVHKANNEHEQLSRENRPIMHPHPPQHESEPTRSVLEELKEISRKRINSGETQKQHEFLKRSCQRIADFVDHHPAQSPATTFKRQRELSVAVPLRHHHAATTTVPQLAPTQTQIQMQTQHHLPITEAISPEQLAKRRNCSYSNDIASSLSSSRRHVSKRKLYDMRESMRQSSMEGTANGSSPEISPSAHVAKMQRKIEAESVSKTQSVPIASVPVVAPQRTISAPTLGQQQQQAAVELPLPVSSKPKLTLFNAKQTQEQLQKQPTKHYDLDSPDVDAGEYAGIQFVKPKQQNSMGGVKNPSVERTHKTKLAIMLSGLRGEIYQGDEPDELDAPVSPKTPIKQPIVALTSKAATATLATTTSISTITKTPTTSISDKPIILTEKVIATAPTAGPATATAPTTTTPMTNGLQPKLLFGQAPTPAATVPKQTPVTTASSSPAATTASSSPAATTVLTFGSPKSTATTTATATSSAPAPALSFGKAPTVGTATPFKLDSNPNSLSKMNGLPSIGGIAAITSVSAPAATATPAAMSFGSSSSTTTAAGTASFMFGKSEESSGAAAAAKPPVFSFGAGTTATATAAPSFFGNPPQSNGFGSAFKQPEAIKASTTVEPEPAKPSTIIGIKSNFGSNSFGSAFKQPAATTTTTTAVTAAAQPSNAFSFSGTTNTSVAPAPAPAANLFAFGGAAAAKPAEPAAAPAPSNSTNIFGQSAAATTPATFSFGGAAAAATAPNTIKETNKPSFAFGGDPSATTAAQSNGSNTNTNNLFNFGAGGTSGTPSFGSAASTNAPSSSAFSFSAAQKPIGSQIDNNNTAPGAATATKPFAFGGGQQQVNGAATAPSGGFSFAAAAKKNEATAVGGASMFGTPNNASTGAKPSFSFGGSSSSTQNGAAAPATGQQSAPAPGQPGAFSFAAVAKKETSGASMFGQPASATPSASIKPSFSFGGSSSNSTQNPAATAPAPAPSFGGFGAAPAPAGNQSKPFAFGGTTAAAPSASPAMGGNLFANAVSAVQNQPKPGGFSFGGTASKTNTHQAAAPPPGNAPFSFGGATAAGGMASPPSSQNVNTTKPFSFGSAASAFGSPSPSPVQAAPAANFGTPSASVAPGMSQQINAGNLFALPPEQRPIRRATRRLQK
ncbi:nuclear pore complex protein DDB_G0274915 [Drosophila subobscura]|uniref:nuclear pore complex protein DDB_G0274915 n=1 Tax=Drosophila subobscura TaxID=7241 RepID=UPI00155A5EC7|nr:nuclear pore complex protein DDB_G0274915 [Drosophila subobscura]